MVWAKNKKQKPSGMRYKRTSVGKDVNMGKKENDEFEGVK